jgi:alkylhydroperoxidase family enzyme
MPAKAGIQCQMLLNRENLREHFSEKETVDLTFAIMTINSWNRLAVSFRELPT